MFVNMKGWFQKRKESIFLASVVLTVIFALIEIVVLVVYRQTWFDEQNYLFKSLTILRGDFVPFRDILVEYPPAFILIYGLPQLLFGTGFSVGRFTAAILCATALVFFFCLVRKMANRWLAFAAVFSLLGSILLMGNYIAIGLYAPSFLVFTILLYVETMTIDRGKKCFLAACCFALLLLMRINLVPAVLGYLVYLVFTGVAWRRIFLFCSITAGLVFVGYLPIVLPNPSLAVSFILLPFYAFGDFREISLQFFYHPDLPAFFFNHQCFFARILFLSYVVYGCFAPIYCGHGASNISTRIF